MNLRQLEYFISVAEHLNFTKAAQSCFISQTAMSLQIQALEEKIGVSLFIRDKHHVELTPAGKVYLKECREILNQVEKAAKLARNASHGISGTLSIGFIRGYEHSHITVPLKNFRNVYPNITLRFLRNNMSSLYEALMAGDCDLAYTLSPLLHDFPQELSQKHLKSYPVMVAMSTSHPLAHHVSLTYRQLKEEDFIIMQAHSRPIEEAEEAMLCYERGGFYPHIVNWERDVQLVLLEASIGMGIALLPEYAVRFYREAENLSIIPLVKENNQAESLDFSLCWKKNNSNPALQHFLSFLFPEEFPS